MASSKKFLKNIKNIKNEHILAIIGFVFLVYALHQYSNNKNIFKLGMGNNNDQIKTPSLASNPIMPTRPIPNKNATSKSSGSVQPSQPTTNTMKGSPINGSTNISRGTNQSEASTLLPGGNGSTNPIVNDDVRRQVSSSPNRNASLDLRKDPPIPTNPNVSPWMISNISRPIDYKAVDITSN
tara:strand:+ start:1382 stop:1927 length:546 start_codon:yes stop_codon:yes gene_type:complete